ncbi:MAG: 5-formyltetrahydrofolate cyclo-ligase [Actinocatenispora sp.]
MSEKSVIRDRLSHNRRAITPARRAAHDQAIRAAVRDLLRDRRRRRRSTAETVRTITGYVPTEGEPGGDQLPEALRANSDRVLLPVLRSDLDLDWAEYTGPDCLQPARWRLCEPSGPPLGRCAISTATILFVPALAVDRAGNRLGRGGGSYDRALARLSTPSLVVALLYEPEVLDRLPAEPHDRRVDAVITPNAGFRRLSPGR